MEMKKLIYTYMQFKGFRCGLSIILLLIISCSIQKYDKNPEFSHVEFITETKKMPFQNNDDYYQFRKQTFRVDSIYYLSIWDLRNNNLTIFNIDNFEIVVNNNFTGLVSASEIHHFDTIFLLYRDGRVVQTDTSFHIYKEWQLEPASEKYHIGEPLYIANNHVYAGYYPNHPLVTKERLTDYFSKPTIIEASLDNPNIILNYYGKFPEVYLKHNYDVTPCRIAIIDNDVITSFKETDNIYMNNKFVASIRSNYFTKNIEQDITKIYDEEYKKKRATENCKYGSVLYNHYTGHYYRMFHFATKYYNKDCTVNSSMDAKKSIIVTDKDFNVLKEVILPPEYFIYDSYITHKGLMIKRENNNDKENIYFDFFSL